MNSRMKPILYHPRQQNPSLRGTVSSRIFRTEDATNNKNQKKSKQKSHPTQTPSTWQLSLSKINLPPSRKIKRTISSKKRKVLKKKQPTKRKKMTGYSPRRRKRCALITPLTCTMWGSSQVKTCCKRRVSYVRYDLKRLGVRRRKKLISTSTRRKWGKNISDTEVWTTKLQFYPKASC